MLSRPDAELVKRDPAIPGLRLLLDTEALVSALRVQLPGAAAITGAIIDYLRYKPGTNCLAAYRLNIDGVTLSAHAIAYRPDLRDKLGKARQLAQRSSMLGPGGVVFDKHAMSFTLFPNDGRLRSLRRLESNDRGKLLRKLMPERPELWNSALHPLRYKPRRRYVAKLSGEDGAQAAIKLYTRHDYPAAQTNADALIAWQGFNVARPLGHSERHHALAFEWLPGRPLNETFAGAQLDAAVMTRVGAKLAVLHAKPPAGLVRVSRDAEAESLIAIAAGIGDIAPRLAGRAHALARTLADQLMIAPAMTTPVHGDFYADQVLVSGNECAFLDFDRAGLNDPASDFGNFIAHLERDVVYGRIASDHAALWRDQLAEGYQGAASNLPARIDLYIAAGLLKLAPEPFRRHEPDWPRRIETILTRAESITSRLAASGNVGGRPLQAPARHADDIDIADPHGAGRDPRMPFLPAALTPAEIRREFSRCLPRLFATDNPTRLTAASVVRYKPGRRCLIEYDLETSSPGAGIETLTLIGKARARGLDEAAFRRQHLLWDSGFAADAADGVSVPAPIGLIPSFQMWLQRKVPGVVATGLLAEPGGGALAERIAQAVYKLHAANIPARRRHTIADELHILRERLSLVSQAQPRWRPRLDRLLTACERLAARMPQARPRGIHRDFYPDQLLVDVGRLWLLDLDLYCEGDPALDIGNFLGHMTEYALRELNHPDALRAQEMALEARYLALADARVDSAAVRGYKTLTLARHIHISTLFADRRAFTQDLLELCEQRLYGGARSASASESQMRSSGFQASGADPIRRD